MVDILIHGIEIGLLLLVVSLQLRRPPVLEQPSQDVPLTEPEGEMPKERGTILLKLVGDEGSVTEVHSHSMPSIPHTYRYGGKAYLYQKRDGATLVYHQQ